MTFLSFCLLGVCNRLFDSSLQDFSKTESRLSGFLSSSLSLLSYPFFFFFCKLDVEVAFLSFVEPNLFLTGFQNIIIYHLWDKRQA